MKRAKYLFLFYIGYVTYITIEVLFHFFAEGLGYSHPLMGILGGLIILALDQINNRISWHLDLFWQACIGSAMITLAELVVGSLWKLTGLALIWDYSNLPLNYNGVICLLFSILWLFISVLGIFIADAINYYFFNEEPCPHYHLGRWIIRFKEK